MSWCSLKKNKFYFAIIVILIGILLSSIAYAILSTHVTIYMDGTISADIMANSGSPADIRSAINLAVSQGGGTVGIPAGTFDWNSQTVTIPNKVSIIGVGAEKTILRQTKAAPFNQMFYFEGTSNTRISGIYFKGLVTAPDHEMDGSAIGILNSIDFRVDHCKFTDFPDAAINVVNDGLSTRTYGVIDHNDIDNPYKITYGGDWGYGIVVVTYNDNLWDNDLTHFLGRYSDIPLGFVSVYVENNVFSNCRYATAGNEAGWYCFRYNTVNLCPNYFDAWAKAGIDVHAGADEYNGARGLEAYSNTFNYVADYAQQAFKLRGGGGVIWNNTIHVDVSYWLIDEGLARDNKHTVYQMYMWDNTGGTIDKDSYYKENVQYFLRAPTQAQDGFTYVPYQYPHPLTNG
jgi:hypothetical protein